MVAVIQDVRKETLLHYSSLTERNEPTLMVVIDVDFELDDGRHHHSQTYAYLPDYVDASIFQKQADAMQADLDHAKQVALDKAITAEQHAAADTVIEKLQSFRTMHKLRFGDKIKIEEDHNV